MNKNLIIKLLGVLGGLLIILGVFLPFVKVTGFSRSLWQTFSENKQVYLSIVIMVFGLIPIVLNLIGKKEEFSFTSVGALLFFLIIETVGTVSDAKLSTLNLGFYSLLIGTILIAVSTIILNRNEKINVLSEQIAPVTNNISNPLEREGIANSPIDNMQNNQNNTQNLELVSDNNQLDNLSNNNEIDMLGEEIPEYQPGYENGVNPVVSEFETQNSESSEGSEVDNSNSALNTENQINENNQNEISQPEVTPAQDLNVASQPEVTPLQDLNAVPQPEVTPLQDLTAAPQPEVTPLQDLNAASQPEVTPLQDLTAVPQPEVTPLQDLTAASQPEVTPLQDLTAAPQPEVTPLQDLIAASQPEVTPAQDLNVVPQPADIPVLESMSGQSNINIQQQNELLLSETPQPASSATNEQQQASQATLDIFGQPK